MFMDERYCARSQGRRCAYAYMDVGKGREHGAEALPTWKAMTVPGHRLAYTSSLGIAAN